MRNTIVGILIALLTCLGGVHSWALDSARDTLQDVENLFVLVEDLPPELDSMGVTKGQIRADVELGLLAADTPVLPMPSDPDLNTLKNYLYVVVAAVPTPGGIAYTVRVDFNQLSVLEHKVDNGTLKEKYRRHKPGASRMFASTWGTQIIGFLPAKTDSGKTIRSEIRKMIDRFTGDFQMAKDTKNDPIYQAMGHQSPSGVQVGRP